jgi:AbrB family looped-hinge helix DNA binding protein
MSIAKSRLTTQGQISVPAEVRRKLGLGPGSVIEWDAEGETVIVRRAGRFSSEEIHDALFPAPPSGAGTKSVKDGIRSYMRKRHARR